MEGSIFGEESNLFTNTLGETKIIQMCPEPEQTKQLLCKIFLSDSFFFFFFAGEGDSFHVALNVYYSSFVIWNIEQFFNAGLFSIYVKSKD